MYLLHVRFDSILLFIELDIPWQVYNILRVKGKLAQPNEACMLNEQIQIY